MATYTHYVWLLGIITIFVASLIQRLTGFGFGLVSVPLLLFILPSREAVLVSIILSIFSLTLHTVRNRKTARWDLIWPLQIIGLPGLVLGVLLSSRLNGVFVKGIVGIALIFYVLFQWVNRWKSSRVIQKESRAASDIESSGHIWQESAGASPKPKGFYLAGFTAGVLNGIAGIPGPPIVAVLVNALNKDVFQATTVNFFLVQYVITFISRVLAQREILSLKLLFFMATMLLPIIFGHWVGSTINKYIDEERFKKLVFGMLFIIGLTSIWTPVKLLWFSY